MKILVIRMSSLGDILLATSFLETLPAHAKVDWVVGSDFEFVLKGHPKVSRLISFQKKLGFRGWLSLVADLNRETYTARVDLHRTLRSRVAFALFKLGDLVRLRSIPSHSVSKERIKTTLYLAFKELVPKFARPTPFWQRFAKLAQTLSHTAGINLALQPPSYVPILESAQLDEGAVLKSYKLTSKNYYALMPASRWSTKEWGAQHYLDLILSNPAGFDQGGAIPLILGRAADRACQELKRLLEEHKIAYRSALEESDFKKTAILLKHAQFYSGSDTGLSHLSESVGTPSFVIFGPTRPDLGFGPWRVESKSVSVSVGCAPCSKDGKICYRFLSPHACLKKLSAEKVRESLPW